MSEGTWEGPADELVGEGYEEVRSDKTGLIALRQEAGERDLIRHNIVHFSPCDEGCRHGGPLAVEHEGDFGPFNLVLPSAGAFIRKANMEHITVQASWRPVDVRRLDFPNDLRPESLAVLCLRCWADRKEST